MENIVTAKYTKMIMSAMKAGEKKKTETYKLIKAKMFEFMTQKNAPELNEQTEISVLNKMVKERQDSALEYERVGRVDLANNERDEIKFIEELLPKAATEQDIDNAINEYINSHGTYNKKMIGIVIKHVKSKFANVDGGLVSKRVMNFMVNE